MRSHGSLGFDLALYQRLRVLRKHPAQIGTLAFFVQMETAAREVGFGDHTDRLNRPVLGRQFGGAKHVQLAVAIALMAIPIPLANAATPTTIGLKFSDGRTFTQMSGKTADGCSNWVQPLTIAPAATLSSSTTTDSTTQVILAWHTEPPRWREESSRFSGIPRRLFREGRLTIRNSNSISRIWMMATATRSITTGLA